MTPSPRYQAVPGYLLEVVEDEVLLYHPVHETMVYCNTTAAYVWGLCDGNRTVDDIVALFVAGYPDAAAEIPEQVRTTVDDLCNRGVLQLRANVDDLAAAVLL